jgi:hypothetical protein
VCDCELRSKPDDAHSCHNLSLVFLISGTPVGYERVIIMEVGICACACISADSAYSSITADVAYSRFISVVAYSRFPACRYVVHDEVGMLEM